MFSGIYVGVDGLDLRREKKLTDYFVLTRETGHLPVRPSMWGDKPMKWTRWATTAALALATVGAPLASARDRCNQDYGRYQSSYTRYDNRGYGANYANSDYRYRNSNYGYRTYDDGRCRGYNEPRSAGTSAAIIGGSAAAGAVIGALAGDGKGAIIGGVAGAIGGVVVDQATKPRNNYGRRW